VFELVRAKRWEEVGTIVEGMNAEVYKLYVADHLDRKTGG
jgi:hypothetical protein